MLMSITHEQNMQRWWPVGPVAPVAPCWPWEPWPPTGPGDPILPWGPRNPGLPTGPLDPVSPVVPISPLSPTCPVSPVVPVNPVAPCGPGWPVEQHQQYWVYLLIKVTGTNFKKTDTVLLQGSIFECLFAYVHKCNSLSIAGNQSHYRCKNHLQLCLISATWCMPWVWSQNAYILLGTAIQ